jgi:hypothetical protein
MNPRPKLCRSGKHAKRAGVPIRCLARLTGVLAFGWLLTGCATPPVPDFVVYNPNNVHRSTSSLPVSVQRLTLLPMSCASANFDLAEARASLEPILRTALIATKRFEVVQATPEMLRSRTGQSAWTGEEPLPADFFESLQATSGCDAVLFSEITVFRGYAPLAIGWRFRLVDVRTRQILWSADEIFDASLVLVTNGARQFDRLEAKATSTPSDGWAILNSPRRFGRYTVSTLLATLPER